MSNRRVVELRKLKHRDDFRAIPFQWLDEGVVLESYRYGDLWCVEYSNPHLFVPQGVWIDDPDKAVRLIKSATYRILPPARLDLAGQTVLFTSRNRLLGLLAKAYTLAVDIRSAIQSCLGDPQVYHWGLRDQLLDVDKHLSLGFNQLVKVINLVANDFGRRKAS